MASCTGSTDRDSIQVPRVSDKIDITNVFDIEIREIFSTDVLNITKMYNEGEKLYLANDGVKKSLLVYNVNESKIEKELVFDPSLFIPIDISISGSVAYILAQNGYLHVYDFNTDTYIAKYELTNAYSGIEAHKNSVIFSKFNIGKTSPNETGFYRVLIFDNQLINLVARFDWYGKINLDGNSKTSIMHPTRSLVKSNDNLFYTKFFCDSIFFFNEQLKNFQFYKFVRFPNQVNYANYSESPDDVTLFEEIARLQTFETGVFNFQISADITFFQFMASGKPALFYENKNKKLKFATKSLYHKKYGSNLPYFELIHDNKLLSIVNESSLLKNSIESSDETMNKLINAIHYEGKNFLFIYTPARTELQ